jgi:hypothetical protein
MGFTINDDITLDTTQTVTGSYAAIADSDIRIMRRSDGSDYTITCSGRVWATQDARNAGAPIIKRDNIRITGVQDAELSESLYVKVYTAWKALYTSTTDV